MFWFRSSDNNTLEEDDTIDNVAIIIANALNMIVNGWNNVEGYVRNVDLLRESVGITRQLQSFQLRASTTNK